MFDTILKFAEFFLHNHFYKIYDFLFCLSIGEIFYFSFLFGIVWITTVFGYWLSPTALLQLATSCHPKPCILRNSFVLFWWVWSVTVFSGPDIPPMIQWIPRVSRKWEEMTTAIYSIRNDVLSVTCPSKPNADAYRVETAAAMGKGLWTANKDRMCWQALRWFISRFLPPWRSRWRRRPLVPTSRST